VPERKAKNLQQIRMMTSYPKSEENGNAEGERC
jgi:hypothetical protein